MKGIQRLFQVLMLSIVVAVPAVAASSDRQLWVDHLTVLADPVLRNLANETLNSSIPDKQGEFEPEYGRRIQYAPLESLGRLMAGLAPWLELGPDNSEEGQLRAEYIDLARRAIANGVNPASPDYLNFDNGHQPLVDVAYLAQAFIRAPQQLWYGLPESVQNNVLAAFEKTRKITDTPYSNWLMFPATLEAFYLKFGYEANLPRIEFALHKHKDWYVGDGVYSDGEPYHWDYYNSYVIQPMLVDVHQILKHKTTHRLNALHDKVMARSQRYAAILERQISPQGTYPIVGRSAIYRFGAFQTLAQMALMERLPGELSEGQVRSAMTAVMKRLLDESSYDDEGWLKIGVIGEQPGLAEPYISTGSLYMASLGFLPLGLPAEHSFWTSPAEDWTAKKVWGGNSDVQRDKSLKD
ncbi:DUF2264 domain-containing protein [Lacimicrobium alkaliphilum]|uniref:DUF2264 domain-containing protein n=1 Tax=Lacimicrobium alkaliphilum TaxID=1526571 RepID=A0ABQ1RA96_9ALTE|nr:DUF2264 domain-containing protein [Lacimicrobium alkaliphilum]GGD60442.1 hypothetical protein GCM10011357_14630 [Lacimicrobium alkaliphilum]